MPSSCIYIYIVEKISWGIHIIIERDDEWEISCEFILQFQSKLPVKGQICTFYIFWMNKSMKKSRSRALCEAQTQREEFE